MIGDVNQILTYGGIFAYPTLESAPEGKLRVQFEGYPIGYVIESAGGRVLRRRPVAPRRSDRTSYTSGRRCIRERRPDRPSRSEIV